MAYQDPEKRRIASRKRYAKNPEKFREAQRTRRAADPEESKGISRRSHKKHRAARNKKRRLAYAAMTPQEYAAYLEYHAQYRENNRAKLRENDRIYVQNHRDQRQRQHARRKARLLSLPATFTQEQHQFMLQYWAYSCAVCGNQEGFEWTLALDHWIPLASPQCPGTVITNMLPLCHGRGGCNNRKNGKDPNNWLLKRFSPQRTRHIEKSIALYFVEAAKRYPQSEPSSAAAD